jgi:hypothetical protein
LYGGNLEAFFYLKALFNYSKDLKDWDLAKEQFSILASPPSEEESRLAASIRLMQKRIDEIEAQAQLVHPVDDSRQITPFMKRTKWHEVIAGMTHESIQNLLGLHFLLVTWGYAAPIS